MIYKQVFGLKKKVSHRSKGIGREGRRKTEAIGFHNPRDTAISLLHEAGIAQALQFKNGLVMTQKMFTVFTLN